MPGRNPDDINEKNASTGYAAMTVLRTRDFRIHLDPLGLEDLKNLSLVRFSSRLALVLLGLMGIAEFCFLIALIIRSLL